MKFMTSYKQEHNFAFLESVLVPMLCTLWTAAQLTCLLLSQAKSV